MFQRLVSAALVAAFVCACPAAAQPAAGPEFSPDRIKADLTFLADDRLEGRRAGERGHEQAADYIEGEFRKMGLTPAGTGGTWRQSVPLIDILPSERATLTIRTGGAPLVLTHRREALIEGAFDEGRNAMTAPLVFVGYGINEPDAGIDDYKGLELKGKIAVMLVAVREVDGPQAPADYESAFKAIRDKGAVGLIMVPSRRLGRIVPWSSIVKGEDEPTTVWSNPDGTGHRGFINSGSLKAMIAMDPQYSSALFAGARRTLDQVFDDHEKGKRPKGFDLKTTVEVVQPLTYRRYQSPNVMGLIEGSDPKLKSEFVILMGHADHLGMAKSGEGDRIYNGALDNAGGIATLLEVARATKTGPERPRRSILVIATTAEEEGLLGSDFFINYPTIPKGSIAAVVNIDMPILTYAFQDVVAYGGEHSSIGKVVDKAAGDMGLKVSPDPEPDEHIFLRSDHFSMVQAGIPSVMLKLGEEGEGAPAWKAYLKQSYHKVGDDLSQPINWQSAARFARLNHRILLDLANAADWPKWYEGDKYGDRYAPDAEKVAR